MKKLSTLIIVFFFGVFAFAQTNNVICTFNHTAAGQPMVLGETIFPIWNGKKVKIKRAQFYISEIAVHNNDASETALTDEYILVNAATPDAQYTVGSWDIQAAHGISLHLGVDQAHNHLDPTTYPANHPLALQSPTMHWGWASGYRFMAIEGFVDNNDDGDPETVFQFHNLEDALYQAVNLEGEQNAANGTLNLHITIDYAQLFKNMTMTGNLIQHGSGAENQKMMANAANEGFLTMTTVSGNQEVELNSSFISATPNPFNSETIIQYDLPAKAALTMLVYNAFGQIVYSRTNLASSGNILFEKGNLPNGIYQYAFYEKGGLLARKQLVINN